MARHVRKSDLVIVTSGRDRGKQGPVLRVIGGGTHVVVEGINLRRTQIRRDQNNPQGGIMDKEMPIHISNVSPVAGGKPTRVRFETKSDGSKLRIAVRTGEKLGKELKQAKKK